MILTFQGCIHRSCPILDSHYPPHPRVSHPPDDECQDAGHLHEGRTEPLGQTSARDGEAAEGEDDPQRDAAQGGRLADEGWYR